MADCEVLEIPSLGAFFTGTNKTIWSQIDRVFINSLWHEIIPRSSFSSRNPPDQLLIFNSSSHKDFQSIVLADLPYARSPHIMQQIRVYLNQLRPKLKQLNSNHFADLRGQQDIAKTDLLQLQHYIALFRQQCKLDWINDGHDCTRFFFARAKQRKLATYIFTIKDATEKEVEGFEQVSAVMLSFYKDLLGQTHFQSAARVHIWATRNLSFAGRAMLINGVIFGMYNYWASIFLLSKDVVQKITNICRNYLWGGTKEHSRVPHISWAHTCKAKKHRRIGIKDYEAWSKATIAKLVWAVCTKKDVLWVTWVHGRYLKNKDWWDYIPAPDNSWTWKKICSIKDIFKVGCSAPHVWEFQGRKDFKVSTVTNGS
ncbi:hypothetical protein Cgig2_014509 [Carnegiea gigantea]|uniref:Uncharacterized protein n=1 Tax=Carnegiea gigantea TaxID=171969 RepID=A0A9Q1GP08_9CARY|nr:hypothetical protein Cgig2_014509 [Carnegiea gigantea]